MFRTKILNEVNESLDGEEITLAGWVNRRRDHGGLIFIDLRDRFGMVQLVFDPEVNEKTHRLAESLRSEFVISITGKVRLRPDGNYNEDLASGKIEVVVDNLNILSSSKTPPFEINNDDEVNEELRLKYRYLDLRRERMQNNIILRYKMIKAMRDFMDKHKFLEIETPMLIKGTPEGSREYLVPSRMHSGNFYVLPQSPQQLKQLLMVSGFDRYFQVARCFRDEDLRGDRQPEFTQFDMEFSFAEEKEVMDLNSDLFMTLAKEFKPNVKFTFEDSIPTMTYDEAMNSYGSDKPDLRFDMPMVDVSDVFRKSEFKVFADCLSNNGVIKALRVEDGVESFSRKDIDELTEVAKIYKAKGLAYGSIKNGEFNSPIAKFLTETEIKNLIEKVNLQENDMVFFAADEFNVACTSLGQVRLAIGKHLNLLDDNEFAVLWITDFPMFEIDEETQTLQASHHPFTAPREDQIDILDKEPLKALSRAYDLVLNGSEIAGGSVRIHNQELQAKIFDLLGITKEDAQKRFGHLLEAFSYGVPPHAGLAWGLDRLIMIFANEPNIREIMAFPKDSRAKDLLLGAPSVMPEENLEELSISIVED